MGIHTALITLTRRLRRRRGACAFSGDVILRPGFIHHNDKGHEHVATRT